jgi:hypothetical protein
MLIVFPHDDHPMAMSFTSLNALFPGCHESSNLLLPQRLKRNTWHYHLPHDKLPGMKLDFNN